MDTSRLLEEVESEISRLQQVAALLRGGDAKPSSTKHRKRKPMSPEARAKIAAAQKKRWDKVRKEKKSG